MRPRSYERVQRLLLGLHFRAHRAAWIRDRGARRDVPECVAVQQEVVQDARIARVLLVLVAQRFALLEAEHGVFLAGSRLQVADAVGELRGSKRVRLTAAVTAEPIELLT